MFENYATPTPAAPPAQPAKSSNGGYKPATGNIQRKTIESMPSWIAFADMEKEAEQVVGSNPTLSQNIQWFIQTVKTKPKMKIRTSVMTGVKDYLPQTQTEFFKPWKDFGQDGEYDKFDPVEMTLASPEIATLFDPSIASIEKPGVKKIKSAYAHALFGRYGKERAVIAVVALKTDVSCSKLTNQLTYKEVGAAGSLASAAYFFDFFVYNLNSSIDVELLKAYLER